MNRLILAVVAIVLLALHRASGAEGAATFSSGAEVRSATTVGVLQGSSLIEFDHERNVAMHRIQAAKPTGLPFERPKDFDLEKHYVDGRFLIGDGKRIRLSFRITRSARLHLLESQLSLDQTVKEQPSHYDISATVVDSFLLDQWIRGFGN